MNRIYSLLALLLVGSASLQAQSDPFPDNNTVEYKYQGSMTCTSQIVMNGAILTDAAVAVYCEDDFRGKNRIGEDPDNPNLVFLYIHGDYTANKQYLHFKVFTQGKVFTCNPDPAIIFTFNGNVGLPSEPYIIDITPVSLANDADNTETLTTWKDKTCDIALTGRTLFKDGSWNTICLPFTLTASEVNEHLENPAGLMTLSSSSFDSTTGTLTLNFSNELENGIVAGKPYIVKWNEPDGYTVDGGLDITAPVFTSVTVSSTAAATTTDGSEWVDFIGTYSSTLIYEDGAEKHNLYLGSGNYLYYPTREGYSVKACRAYFQLKNGLTAGDARQQARAFVLNFGDDETTGIVPIDLATPHSLGENGQWTIDNSAGAWYDMQGRRIANGQKPKAKGLYIVNGNKVVIK